MMYAILNDHHFDATGIKRLEPPLTQLETYTFFAAQYSAIAEKYQQALVAMKKEGVYQSILVDTK